MEMEVVMMEMDQTNLESGSDSHQFTTAPVQMRADLCVVCGDRSSGRHYGAISCEGCKGFFKRSLRKALPYSCRCNQNCAITKYLRNRCQYCRLQKCLQMGMRCDRVQSERKPQPLSNGSGNLDYEQASPLSPPFFSGFESNLNRSSSNDGVYDTNSSQEDDGESVSETAEQTALEKAWESINNVIQGKDDTSCSQMFAEIDLDSIVPEGCTLFALVDPFPENGLLDLEFVGETASRLLILSIHWARSLPAFQALSYEMQVALAKSSWNELFIIGLVQCQDLLSMRNVISAFMTHHNQTVSPQFVAALDHVTRIQHFVKTVLQIQMDDYELAALKALTLFTSDRVLKFGPSVVNAIQGLHSIITNQLIDHVSSHRENAVLHVANILRLLPQIRGISSTCVEELYFTNVSGIETTPIHMIIPYMLKTDHDFHVVPDMNMDNNIDDGACSNGG